MAINMECDGEGLVCAESKLAGSEEAEERSHRTMKRLVILRRCQPIVRFSCCCVRYADCRHNHAASTGGYAVDGCREFIPDGEEGTFAALKCSACGCHRSFHRRVQVYEVDLRVRRVIILKQRLGRRSSRTISGIVELQPLVHHV